MQPASRHGNCRHVIRVHHICLKLARRCILSLSPHQLGRVVITNRRRNLSTADRLEAATVRGQRQTLASQFWINSAQSILETLVTRRREMKKLDQLMWSKKKNDRAAVCALVPEDEHTRLERERREARAKRGQKLIFLINLQIKSSREKLEVCCQHSAEQWNQGWEVQHQGAHDRPWFHQGDQVRRRG